MATRLRDLRLEEISLVDAPANKGARVLLFKRDGGQDDVQGPRASAPNEGPEDQGRSTAGSAGDTDGGIMTKQVEKRLAELDLSEEAVAKVREIVEAETAAMARERDDAHARAEKAEADLRLARDELAKASAPEDPVQKALSTVPDEVRKQIEPVLKQNEELAARIAKAEEERDITAIAKRLDGMSFGETDKLAAALHRLAKASGEDAGLLEQALLAAREQIAHADALTRSIGTSRPALGSAFDRATAEAEALMKSAPGKFGSINEARAEVWKRNPDLTAQYEQERRAH